VRQILGFLPEELLLVSSEVAEGTGLPVNGLLELQLLDEHTGSQIEVSDDDISQVIISESLNDGAVRVDVDGQGLGNSDGVGNVDQTSLAEAVGNQRLGDPSGSVGSRSVDLGWILSREGTASMTTPSSVGIDNDLSSSKTGISAGSSDHKRARRVQVVDSLIVNQVLREGWLDDELVQIGLDLFVGDIRGVLAGDQDGVDSDWDQV